MVCRVGAELGLQLIGGAPQAEAYLAMIMVRQYADAYTRFQKFQATLSPQERYRRSQKFDLLCRSRGYPGYFITEKPCRCPQLYVAGHKVEANQPALRDLVARRIVRTEAAKRTVTAALERAGRYFQALEDGVFFEYSLRPQLNGGFGR